MTEENGTHAEGTYVPWWMLLIEGIAAILLGLMLLMQPAATLALVIQLLGIYWLVKGVFYLVSLFWNRSGWGWKVFNGLLGIIAGLLIIQNPWWSTLLVPATVAILIGVMGMVIGIAQLFQAFKGGGWGLGILGVLSIFLGLLLLTRPIIAGLALPWVLGFLAIIGGLLALFAAFKVKGMGKEAQAATVEPTRVQPAAQPLETAPAADAPVPMAAPTPAAAPAAAAAEVGTAALVAEQAAPEAAAPGAEAAAEAGMDGRVETEAEALAAAEAGVEAAVETAPAEAVEAAPELDESPVEVGTGNVDPADSSEMAKFKYDLEYVEGIGPAYAGKLKTIGLVTCLDLLKAGASRKGREEIVEKTGISNKLILKWVNHVDLYRIKGVGSEYADLLEASGVDTVVELAQRNPANLLQKMVQVNTDKSLVRKAPTAAQVEDWVAQAKGLPRGITY